MNNRALKELKTEIKQTKQKITVNYANGNYYAVRDLKKHLKKLYKDLRLYFRLNGVNY